jgi:hypothetical protein
MEKLNFTHPEVEVIKLNVNAVASVSNDDDNGIHLPPVDID